MKDKSGGPTGRKLGQHIRRKTEEDWGELIPIHCYLGAIEKRRVRNEMIIRGDEATKARFARLLTLRHWHTADHGLVIGDVSPGCPLCREAAWAENQAVW